MFKLISTLLNHIKARLRKYATIYSILALPFSFHLIKYLNSWYLSWKYPYENLLKFNFKKNIVIVGSGPSLDVINLNLIQNSTVIFLNGAILKHEFFNFSSNNFLWYAQDINGINRHIETASKYGVKKVLTIGNWNTPLKFRKFLNKDDIFFLTSLAFGRDYDYENNKSKYTYSFRPNFLGFDGHNLAIDSLKKPYLHSLGSVIFSAISFSIFFKPKNIILIGFDATTNPGVYNYATGTKSLDQQSETCLKSSDFNDYIVNKYLLGYKKLCDILGIAIFNYSPLTNERVLPKIYTEHQLNNLLKTACFC